jgi:hypothetical protein
MPRSSQPSRNGEATPILAPFMGIGVSATTIATVLRSAGLGPAPRRIGPQLV